MFRLDPGNRCFKMTVTVIICEQQSGTAGPGTNSNFSPNELFLHLLIQLCRVFPVVVFKELQWNGPWILERLDGQAVQQKKTLLQFPSLFSCRLRLPGHRRRRHVRRPAVIGLIHTATRRNGAPLIDEFQQPLMPLHMQCPSKWYRQPNQH